MRVQDALFLVLIVAQGVPTVRPQAVEQSVRSQVAATITARLVFREAGLAAAWLDPDARTAVIRDHVVLEDSYWRARFQSTGGVAVVGHPKDFTVTADDMSEPGSGLSFSQMQSAILVQQRGLLVLSNISVADTALYASYEYTDDQPYQNAGLSWGLWPSIALAPGGQIVLTDVRMQYQNASQASCVKYTQKTVSALQQQYGASNVMAVSATAIRFLGPLHIPVKVLDGKNTTTLGTATAVYRNVTFNCLAHPDDDSQAEPGLSLSPGALAAVLTASLVSFAAAVAGLLYIQRRRLQHVAADNRQSRCSSMELGVHCQVCESIDRPCGEKPIKASTMEVSSSATTTEQSSRASVSRSPTRCSCPDSSSIALSSPTQQLWRAGSNDISLAGCSSIISRNSSIEPSHRHCSRSNSDVSAALAQQPTQQPTSWPLSPSPAAAAFGTASTPVSETAAAASLPQHACPAAIPEAMAWSPGVSHLAEPNTCLAADHGFSGLPDVVGSVSAATAVSASSSHSCSRQASSESSELGATEQVVPGPPGASTRTGTPSSTSSGSSQSLGSSKRGTSRGADGDEAALLLKIRSDMAVLRDLKLGPLLGRGSYGRVYKGRWKGAAVAVKMMEHFDYKPGTAISHKGLKIGQEVLLATRMAHPNLVQTYHILTMTVAQRYAMASAWLKDRQGGIQPGLAADATASKSCDEGDLLLDSSGDELQKDLLETWMLMEFCERGSLERAVRRGKFRTQEGTPNMIGIYKALLDTASGLDYLHSIGVVHGDLKTANVLLKGSTRDVRGFACKITDFGLSRVLDLDATHISTRTHGTMAYMPAELLQSGCMTQATDVYSLGLMMWELYTGNRVFGEGLSLGQIFHTIVYQSWRPSTPADCPAAYAHLMQACWHADPQQRPTAQQVLRALQKLYITEKRAAAAAGDLPNTIAQANDPAPAASTAPVKVAVSGTSQLTEGASQLQTSGSGGCSAAPMQQPDPVASYSSQPAAAATPSVPLARKPSKRVSFDDAAMVASVPPADRITSRWSFDMVRGSSTEPIPQQCKGPEGDIRPCRGTVRGSCDAVVRLASAEAPLQQPRDFDGGSSRAYMLYRPCSSTALTKGMALPPASTSNQLEQSCASQSVSQYAYIDERFVTAEMMPTSASVVQSPMSSLMQDISNSGGFALRPSFETSSGHNTDHAAAAMGFLQALETATRPGGCTSSGSTVSLAAGQASAPAVVAAPDDMQGVGAKVGGHHEVASASLGYWDTCSICSSAMQMLPGAGSSSSQGAGQFVHSAALSMG